MYNVAYLVNVLSAGALRILNVGVQQHTHSRTRPLANIIIIIVMVARRVVVAVVVVVVVHR